MLLESCFFMHSLKTCLFESYPSLSGPVVIQLILEARVNVDCGSALPWAERFCSSIAQPMIWSFQAVGCGEALSMQLGSHHVLLHSYTYIYDHLLNDEDIESKASLYLRTFSCLIPETNLDAAHTEDPPAILFGEPADSR